MSYFENLYKPCLLDRNRVGLAGNYALNYANLSDVVTVGNTSDFAWMHGKGNISNFKWTVDFLVKITHFPISIQYFLYTQLGASGIGFALFLDNRTNISRSRRLRLYISNGSNSINIPADIDGPNNTYPNDSDWHRLTFTYDHSLDNFNAKVYIDGSFIFQGHKKPHNGSNSDSTNILHIGNRDTLDHNISGYMSDIRIFDRVLTPQEIDEIKFSRLIGNESGLVNYWKIDEGSGLVINDSKGDKHGDIQGPTWIEPNDFPII